MLFLLCQATGLKYNEAPECTGDVTGATPAACDELGADGCDGKYTSLRWRVVSTPVSNCLAVGPLCKRPDAASMTCSSLLDCEGKGWKKTWTSGTATTYSEDLGKYVLLGYVKDNGEMSRAWFFKTPDSWKSTHPAPARGRDH